MDSDATSLLAAGQHGRAEPAPRRRRGHGALLLALAVDNAGSGLFLPLAAVYITRVVGVPLAQTGALLTAGTVVGLAAPPLAGRCVDRVGPRVVVVTSQLLQAAGLVVYLLGSDAVAVLLAAALVAAGTQTFYSSLFALIADTAGPGPQDRPFALVGMVRSAAFGVGALVAAVLLWWVPAPALRAAVGIDVVTFVVAALALSLLVHPLPHHVTPGPATTSTLEAPAPVAGSAAATTPWRDRPYLALIATTALVNLPTDFFLLGGSSYAITVLHAPAWVPGASTALLTAVLSTTTTAVVAATAGWSRTRAMTASAWVLVAWAALAAAALLLPRAWVGPWLLAITLVLAAGSVLGGTRANALAEAAAPPARRGRYLAGFQYAFTVAGLAASLLVSALAAAAWLPWVVVGAAAVSAALALPVLSRRLPAHAVRPPAPGPAGR